MWIIITFRYMFIVNVWSSLRRKKATNMDSVRVVNETFTQQPSQTSQISLTTSHLYIFPTFPTWSPFWLSLRSLLALPVPILWALIYTPAVALILLSKLSQLEMWVNATLLTKHSISMSSTTSPRVSSAETLASGPSATVTALVHSAPTRCLILALAFQLKELVLCSQPSTKVGEYRIRWLCYWDVGKTEQKEWEEKADQWNYQYIDNRYVGLQYQNQAPLAWYCSFPHFIACLTTSEIVLLFLSWYGICLIKPYLHSPDHDRSVFRPRNHPCRVLTSSCCNDLILVAQECWQTLSCFRVPYIDCFIQRRRHEACCIWGVIPTPIF